MRATLFLAAAILSGCGGPSYQSPEFNLPASAVLGCEMEKQRAFQASYNHNDLLNLEALGQSDIMYRLCIRTASARQAEILPPSPTPRPRRRVRR